MLSLWNICGAVTSAPVLLRACLDNNDSTVTIDFSALSDLCGSFVEHHVYGSETGTNYKLLYTENHSGATAVKFKLPNANPTWSFYFDTRFLCNGVDSDISNTIKVDITKPDLIEIDSVSIDVATQKLVVGWQKNPAPDTKGYRIYRNVNSVNSIIGDTVDTQYIVKNQNVTQKLAVTLATFDSCNLFSAISSGHSAMILSTSLDPCTKTASLSWSKYVGWDVDNQHVFTSTNGGPYSSQAIDGSKLSSSYPGLNFGDSVCFYVRATKNGATPITSSSNVSCVKLDKPALPKTTYLSQVTVSDESTIDIEVYVENQGLSDSIVLYKVAKPDKVVGSLKLSTGDAFYFWKDQPVKTNKKFETYFVRTFAPCLGGTSTSLNSNSIHLKIDGEELSWNGYTNWDGGVQDYSVYAYDGSTWNIIANTQDLFYTNTDTTLQCFYIEAVENQNAFGFLRTSQSNTVCAKRDPIFFVPNTLNPLSQNNTFRVIGPSIDKSQSTMSIFNRWGEIIFTTNNVDEGWSVDASKTFIPLGVYFYDVALLDLNGNKHRLSGSVRVIR